ncbi:MAG TPA: serine/threonine-protein kinase, partial [Gemmatimonadales bacterium]|nr:serine/threonine-protein kinase [Gemmatimonadales bacterium]
MKCFRCGAEVPADQRFCGQCGVRVSDPHEETIALPAEDEGTLLRTVRLVFAGEYDVEREVGRGGMAVVFKATELALRRPVALKVLPPEVGVTPKAVERFQREARLIGELDHPNITPVYRAGQVGGILHIVMKYVEGRTLERILQDQGPLPVPVALAVLRGAARALTYAHERNIVHRDVKGANILIDRDGRVLVSDFGVALRASDVTLTAPGAIIGTPAFMSPEQCAGRRALPQSDQYALGIVAFHMLAGSVPFHGDTLAGVMQHHFFTPVPDLRRVRPDIPPQLIEVVNRALAKDPRDRYRTTREMLTAIGAVPFSEIERQESERLLRELARGTVIDRVRTEELPALPEMPTLRVPPMPPRRRLLVPVGVSAAAVLGLAAVIWGLRPWGSR